MAKLALIQKWNPTDHGASSTEGIYLPYLQTKYLVYRVANTRRQHIMLVSIGCALADGEVQRALGRATPRRAHIIKKMYRYRDRDFAVLNYGLEKFQRIWRNYYARLTHLKKYQRIWRNYYTRKNGAPSYF